MLRPILPLDREPLAALLQRADIFDDDEIDVALELIDESIRRPNLSGYRCLVATKTGGDELEQILGYACFGRTPMTVDAYDLYWIVVDTAARGRGIGHQLVEALCHTVENEGGGVIRVETSSQESYGKSVTFYLKEGFTEAGRIPSFYKPHDDLLILFRTLPG